MTTITKIIYPCSNDIMGDTSDDDCDAYRDWFAEQLHAEYPDTEITVTNSAGRIELTLDDGSYPGDLIAEVHEFGNRCWDSCPWDF
jgi:hypothetical protein